jgi:hypothetical protein
MLLCGGGSGMRRTGESVTVAATTPLGARFRSKLHQRDADRSRVAFPSPLFKGRIGDFARDVLGMRSLASHQVEVLEEWQKDGRVEIADCTGQKLGKTAELEVAAGYDFATTHKLNGFVFGPKLEHTNEVFWPRFALLIVSAYYPCASCMPAHRAWCALVEADPLDETPRPERCTKCSPLIPSELRDPKDPKKGRVSEWLDPVNSERGLRAPDGRAIRGYAGRKEGSKGGFSGAVRFYCDESSDISDVDRETVRGNMSGGGKAIFAGNMLYQWGWFYRAFTTERASYTFVRQMSSRLSPNIPGRVVWSDGEVTENRTGDRPVLGMATREDVEANLKAWKGTNYIAARIDAIPPKIIEGQLAPVDRVQAAEERWRPDGATGLLQIGVDVARARDRLGICVRRGSTMLELFAEALHEDDHARGVALVLDYAAKHRGPHERPPRLAYDASGLEGAAFTKELEAQLAVLRAKSGDDVVELYPVQMAHPPRNRKLFDKRRDEIAHSFADKLKTIGILSDLELQGEIAATVGESVEVSYGASGQKWRVLRVIDNDALRKRIGRSPDKRNASELAFLDVDGSEVPADSVDEAPPVAVAAGMLASARASRPVRGRQATRRRYDEDEGPLPSFDPFALADAAAGWGLR